LYIAKGDPNGEIYEPRFTYHGFQYVQVEGLKVWQSECRIFWALVLSSATPKAGTFETDNAFVNQLYHNIVWTQQSNYLEVPTDCPQRDERLGWTGDAQAYVKSATLNNDIAAFGTKWVVDLNDAQLRQRSLSRCTRQPRRYASPIPTRRAGWKRGLFIRTKFSAPTATPESSKRTGPR
jgi:alpha-L-rhamnosidase